MLTTELILHPRENSKIHGSMIRAVWCIRNSLLHQKGQLEAGLRGQVQLSIVLLQQEVAECLTSSLLSDCLLKVSPKNL